MQPHGSALRRYGDTDFITGLRAIAATMVIIIHTGAFWDFGDLGRAITSAGKNGVDIFFVISGFTVAKTFLEAKTYSDYLTRRAARILPLYWLVISVATALWWSGYFSYPDWMESLGAKPDFYNFFMHLSMVSYLDYRVANSLAGVEWTIPVEVFWYVMLPFCLGFTRTPGRLIMAIIFVLMLTAVMSYLSKITFGTVLPVKWSPIAHGHLFFIGAAAYFLRKKFENTHLARAQYWIGGAALFFIVGVVVDFGGRAEVLALGTAIFIVVLTPERSRTLNRMLTARPLLFLGTISYSLYLTHWIIFHILNDISALPDDGVLRFLLVYLVTILISSVTYFLVERPTNMIGHQFVARRAPSIV